MTGDRGLGAPGSSGPAEGVRVVSLVPSVSETLVAWGITPVGVTRYCDQPGLPLVGGTKDPDREAIAALRPDLVVMCREENRRADAEGLRSDGHELFVFDINRIDDVAPQIAALAERLGLVVPEIDPIGPAAPTTMRAFVPIWRRPWMTMGGRCYGSAMLAHLGVDNVMADAQVRYPETTLAQAVAAAPDVVIAPSEPYPFGRRHVPELSEVAPVILVDGRDLFWWGVRTGAALGRLAEVLAEGPGAGGNRDGNGP